MKQKQGGQEKEDGGMRREEETKNLWERSCGLLLSGAHGHPNSVATYFAKHSM
jgi:hypothetical protein